MSSTDGEREIVLRARRGSAVIGFPLALAFVASALFRIARDGLSTHIVGRVVVIAAFGALAAFDGWRLFARPPLVVADADGLRWRAGVLARFPSPLPWPAIREFTIIRRRPAPLAPRSRLLCVMTSEPWHSGRTIRGAKYCVAHYGTPYVIRRWMLDASLEDIVDGAHTFKDVPLTYPDMLRWSDRQRAARRR